MAALSANEPMVVGDLAGTTLSETEMSAYRRWGFRSMVSLPLVVEGRAIGLIDVFDTRVRDFTPHLDMIRNVGRLLAGSFEKAMLVERLEQGNRDLSLLVDSSLEFGATLDVDAVLRAVAERLLEVSEADLCDVFQLDGDEVEILVSLGSTDSPEVVGQRYSTMESGILQEGRGDPAARRGARHPERARHDRASSWRTRGATGTARASTCRSSATARPSASSRC